MNVTAFFQLTAAKMRMFTGLIEIRRHVLHSTCYSQLLKQAARLSARRRDQRQQCRAPAKQCQAGLKRAVETLPKSGSLRDRTSTAGLLC